MTPATSQHEATHALRPQQADRDRIVAPAEFRKKRPPDLVVSATRAVTLTLRGTRSPGCTHVAPDVPAFVEPAPQTQTA
jgi:hypothetical protein